MVDTKSASLSNGQRAKLPAIFPWPIDSLVIPEKGCGLGNPLTTNAKNMAEPFREQVGYWIFKRDVVSGALVLPGKATIGYFRTGEDEIAPASSAVPWLQNLATCNLFQNGTPVTRDNLFAMLAMGIGIGRPFALVKDEAGVIQNKRSYAPWVDSYGERARDLLWSTVGMAANFRDAACSFEFGNISNYPPVAGQVGGPTVRAGAGFGVMSMLPIPRGPVYLGAQDQQNQVAIVATTTPEDLVLDQDAMIPTVSDIAVPMHVLAYGDFGPWCGVCAPSSEDIDALVSKRVEAAMVAAGLKK
jgi:hypothetical protein